MHLKKKYFWFKLQENYPIRRLIISFHVIIIIIYGIHFCKYYNQCGNHDDKLYCRSYHRDSKSDSIKAYSHHFGIVITQKIPHTETLIDPSHNELQSNYDRSKRFISWKKNSAIHSIVYVYWKKFYLLLFSNWPSISRINRGSPSMSSEIHIPIDENPITLYKTVIMRSIRIPFTKILKDDPPSSRRELRFENYWKPAERPLSILNAKLSNFIPRCLDSISSSANPWNR